MQMPCGLGNLAYSRNSNEKREQGYRSIWIQIHIGFVVSPRRSDNPLKDVQA